MGNFFSRPFKRKGDQMVFLEMHKKLVDGHSATTDNAEMEMIVEPFFSQESLGLRILTGKRDGGDSSSVLSRKVEDARIVTVQSMPFRWYTSAWVKVTQPKVFGFDIEAEMTRMREGKPKDHEELFRPLELEEDEEVSHALDGDNSHEILITHKPSNIEISREVLQCLRPDAWLNDEVINLYLELLKERERSQPNKFLKCHFFNTFFYNKLNGKGDYNYSAVRRWTTKKKLGYTLIECDKVFVPVHKRAHWSLAVINIKDKSFQYLDSLGTMDVHVLELLAAYLMDELRDKIDDEIDTISWKKEAVNDLPLQENGSDCGMFMIKYTDFCSRGLKPSFGQEHMAYFRRKTASEILRLRVQ